MAIIFKQIDELSLRLSATVERSVSFPFFFFTFFMSIGGLSWGILCIVFGLYTAAIIPLLYVVFSVFNILILRKEDFFYEIRFFQTLNSVLMPFIFQAVLGGIVYTGAVMVWSLLSLIACLMFYKKNQVWLWLLTFAVLVGTSVYFDQYFQYLALEPLKSHTAQQSLFFANFLMVGAIVFFLGSYFINSQRKTFRQLKQLNTRVTNSEKKLHKAYQEVLSSEEEAREFAEELQRANANLSAANKQLINTQKYLENALAREKKALNEVLNKDAEIIKKNQAIQSSLNYAKRIQDALLLSKGDLQTHFPESFIIHRARDTVSGDFYWFGQQANKIITGAIDCTGHGVPGAIVSIIGNEKMNEIVHTKGITTPNKILNELHKSIVDCLKQRDTRNRDGMDMSICTYDKSTNTLETAGAKSPFLYIQRNQLFEIKGEKLPIGLVIRANITERAYQKHTVNIDNTTCCYMLSDGFQDQFGGLKNKRFMLTRLKKLLQEIHPFPMKEQKKNTRKHLRQLDESRRKKTRETAR